MPKLASLMLLAIATFSLHGHATSGTVVLAWSPQAPSDATLPIYDVYGVADEAATLLGSTELTTFAAPAGYPSYLVKVRGSEGSIPTVCIIYHPDGPSVAAEIDCA